MWQFWIQDWFSSEQLETGQASPVLLRECYTCEQIDFISFLYPALYRCSDNFWTMLTLRTCRSILQVWVKIEILKPVTSQELLHFVVTYNQIWRLQKQAWFDKWSDYLKPVPQIRKVVLMFNLIIALKVSYPSVTQLIQDSNFWKLPKIINNFQAKDCKR